MKTKETLKQSVYFFTEEEFKDIQCSAFTDEQLILLREPTPESEIEYKEDKSGFKYKTVKGSYMKKRMNLIFGFNYDFEIKSREYFQASSEVLVEGRLTIRSGNFTIIKEQFGKHTLTSTTKTSGNKTYTFASDIGNAYKSAATDSFKKCASEIGLCWDIYTQEAPETKGEIKTEEDHNAKKITERLEHFLKSQTTLEGLKGVIEQFKANNEVNDNHQKLIDDYKKRMNKTIKND